MKFSYSGEVSVARSAPFATCIFLLLSSRTDRSDFKMEPCKMKSILGWLVQMGDDPLHPDSFHLADPNTGKLFSIACLLVTNL